MLEELTLWGESGYGVENREDVFDQIVEVVMRKESHFPGLKAVKVDQLPGQGVQALREICLARGVQFLGY